MEKVREIEYLLCKREHGAVDCQIEDWATKKDGVHGLCGCLQSMILAVETTIKLKEKQ